MIFFFLKIFNWWNAPLAVVTPVDFGTEELSVSVRVIQENGRSEKETERHCRERYIHITLSQKVNERAWKRVMSVRERTLYEQNGDDVAKIGGERGYSFFPFIFPPTSIEYAAAWRRHRRCLCASDNITSATEYNSVRHTVVLHIYIYICYVYIHIYMITILI